MVIFRNSWFRGWALSFLALQDVGSPGFLQFLGLGTMSWGWGRGEVPAERDESFVGCKRWFLAAINVFSVPYSPFRLATVQIVSIGSHLPLSWTRFPPRLHLRIRHVLPRTLGNSLRCLSHRSCLPRRSGDTVAGPGFLGEAKRGGRLGSEKVRGLPLQRRPEMPARWGFRIFQIKPLRFPLDLLP